MWVINVKNYGQHFCSCFINSDYWHACYAFSLLASFFISFSLSFFFSFFFLFVFSFQLLLTSNLLNGNRSYLLYCSLNVSSCNNRCVDCWFRLCWHNANKQTADQVKSSGAISSHLHSSWCLHGEKYGYVELPLEFSISLSVNMSFFF